jgi:hypothetical protein
VAELRVEGAGAELEGIAVEVVTVEPVVAELGVEVVAIVHGPAATPCPPSRWWHAVLASYGGAAGRGRCRG